MKRYADKTIMVTGGGGGIGRAIALRLAGEGGAIAVLDKNGQAADETVSQVAAAGGRAAAVIADITDWDSVQNAVAEAEQALGPLDVLVNNAGWAQRGSLEDTAPEDWDKEIAVNLRGHFLAAKAVLPGMVARGHGVIVNIGSVNGFVALGNPGYSAAKAGLYSLTQTLSGEYGPKGIRTNMISPGTIETDIETWRIRRQKNPEIFDTLARWYPVGRVGQPEDIAAATAYIAADEAAFVNGANLMVDGGLTASLNPMIEEFVLE
ncbi:MAG: glucose 1-dehydrogenase [Alphaproteobacteria bacterium]|nr:glucose 1-dehydrogenase [Alphaproteobacteria bacterium]MDP6590490.1 glucose 1-dehydrogenase [Alphaproteobacteria bacterium]MDP6816937.1 glucose 1-dehydrogenase [Alphaproteobacteria bacterium]